MLKQSVLIILVTLLQSLYAQVPKLIGPPGGRVYKIAIHPTLPNIVYAAPQGGSIFISEDGGETNKAIVTDFKNIMPDVIALPHGKEDYVYLSYGGYYLRSIDKGKTWEIIHGTGKSTNSNISFNPYNSDVIYIVQNYKDIWKTYDSGDNWHLTYRFEKSMGGIVVSHFDTSVVYCSADDSFYKSMNSGFDWFKQTEIEDRFLTSMIENSQNKNSLFFSSWTSPYLGLFKSIDGGKTVEQISSRIVNAFVVDPEDTVVLYAAEGLPVYEPYGGIIKTIDGGKNWETKVNGIPGSYVTALSLEMNIQNPKELYAGIGDLGVFKTEDGGENWFLTRLTNAEVLNIFIDESFAEGKLITGQYGWGLMQTTDNGKTWEHPKFNTEFQHLVVHNLEFHPTDKSKGFFAGWDGLYKTINKGKTWSLHTNQLNKIVEISYHPLKPDVLFAGGGGTVPACCSKLYKSIDGGNTWKMKLQTMYDGASDFIYHPTDPNIIYARYTFGVRKSEDMGETWVEKNNGLLSLEGSLLAVTSLKMHNENPEILYCTQGYRGGLFITYNGGENWVRIDSSLTSREYRIGDASCLLLDKMDENRIYTQFSFLDPSGNPIEEKAGLYLTEDHGKTWMKVLSETINVIKADNSTPRNIYIGTNYGVKTFVDTFHVKVGVDEREGLNLVKEYKLSQNYPNPFNPSTLISYSIPQSGNVKIVVYDILGNEVDVLTNKYHSVGNYKITFTPKTLSSGIYFYRLISKDLIETKKMIYLR